MSRWTQEDWVVGCGVAGVLLGPFALLAGFMVLAAVLVKWVLS